MDKAGREHRTKLWACSCGIAAALLLGSATAVMGQDDKNAGDRWDKYQVLVERNMFSRLRGRASRRPAEAPRPAPPSPERYVVLTGIAKQGEEHIAFLEDTRTGEVSKVRTGDTVLEGRISKMTLDWIEYGRDGEAAKVEIGQNLEGGASTSLPAADFESTTAGADAIPAADSSRPTGVGGEAEAEILTRLRAKRQRELGR